MSKYVCPECQGTNRKCSTCGGFGQVDEKGLRRFELAQKVRLKETNPNPYIDNF
jgi:DnaJ-class molecular chaperone